MAAKNDFMVTTAPNEVIMTRTIDAPPELVFDAFTQKEHLEKWFGPHGFRTTAESDPRKGGTFRITMHGTDALPEEFRGDYPMHGEYLEFERPTKVVFTNNLDEHPKAWKEELKRKCGADDDEALNSVATVTFEDIGGKTKVTLRSTFTSNAVRDGYIETGMNEGWAQSFERLEEHILADRMFSATRLLDAPRDLVWKVFTESGHVQHWWGPNGFSLTTHEMNVRSGGEWKFTMHGPDIHGTQTDFDNHNYFDEVVKPEKIVYSHVSYPKHQTTITFDDLGEQTKMHWRMVFDSADMKQRTIKEFGAEEGLTQTLGRLEAYLNTF